MIQIVLASLVIGASPLLLALAFMASEKLVEGVLRLFDQSSSWTHKRPTPPMHRPKVIGRRSSGAKTGSAQRSSLFP